MKAWYLLYCKPRGESRALQNLTIQNIETYLPTIAVKKEQKGQVSVVKTSLFPSYLFIKFDPKEVSVSRINSTRGVVQVVGCKELMTPIDDGIIDAIRQQEYELNSMTQGSTDIGSSSNEEFEPKVINPGEKVRLTEGVFSTLEGIFQEKSGDKRCHVLFEIMGEMKSVKIPMSIVKPSD
ncbi:NusG antitermination factor [Shewanella sediminis HAW-EB3]|uniref:Transcription antitermination protein RfaH n=1 Tax=Shewanella sediminis (strain HAW-EB3) TaxID=425104 RepID=A8FXR4_SHESH|nr:transcription/translation regulatory transformer protein RfaH [Shewanella sediminis]ABV37637.1 NusG antitermination factor [Shewanella sediminis HAW-EB3]